ncbi:MAG: hypothetical protein AMXMBFR13_08480 [Phycisphaerae bacterium]
MRRWKPTFLIRLTTGLLLAAAYPAQAGSVGDYARVDDAGGWNPDVAFDPDHGLYLVVWTGPEMTRGRFIHRDGQPLGDTFDIHDGVGGARFPAVAFSPAHGEFLVTWDGYDRPGQPDTIFGQRVRSPDGALVGSNFRIMTSASIRSQVAWGSVSQCYMVVSGYGAIVAQRVSGSGMLLGSQINVSVGWMPGVSYSPGADAFLVSWDHESPPDIPGIGAKRYAAASGAPLEDTFAVSPTVADRSHSTHDAALGRWLVQYQDHTFGYDQYVRFINDDGTPGSGPLPAADTPAFEGETHAGCDIAFSSGAGAYLSVFGMNEGIFGQILDRNGTRRRSRITLGTGEFTFHSNAADPTRDRFLTVWSGSPVAGGAWYVYYRFYDLYTPVTGLSATPEPRRIRLTWNQPADTDMTHVMIRFSTAGTPANTDEGSLAARLAVTPGTSGSFIHAGLDRTQTYHYAVFAYDGILPAWSVGVSVNASPGLAGDMDADGDVDQSDFGWLQVCLSGSGQPYPPSCAIADLEGDGDVDQGDLDIFRACMGGANQPPGC